MFPEAVLVTELQLYASEFFMFLKTKKFLQAAVHLTNKNNNKQKRKKKRKEKKATYRNILPEAGKLDVKIWLQVFISLDVFTISELWDMVHGRRRKACVKSNAKQWPNMWLTKI